MNDEYPIHPYAEMFPLRPGKPLKDLAASMQEHGQIEDAVIFEGQLLDGRRRQQAAKLAGIPLRVREFGSRLSDGADPLDFAFAVNFHRRDDLTVAEKLLAAAKYATAKRGSNRADGETRPVTQDEAAEKFAVPPRQIERAARVLRGVPELEQAVLAEAVSVSDAAAIAGEPPGVQRQAVAAVQAGQAKTLKAAVQKAAASPSPTPRPENAARIGRALAGLIERLQRVEADAGKRNEACERLRIALELIESLHCAAAA